MEMDPALVRDIVFLPNGVEGLVVRSGERNQLLRLKRGKRISFRLEGRPGIGGPKDPCILCDGSRCLKGTPDCMVPHVVYMALFGRLGKIGVTKAARFDRRMREQGARFAARISSHEDGLSARKVEKELTRDYGLRGGIRFEEKMATLGEPGSMGEADEIAGTFSLPFEIGMEDLQHLYQNEHLMDLPKPILLGGDSIKGRIEDTRGEALFLIYRDNLYAFDLRRTIGRNIILGGTRIDAQLTLENF
jgi:hypothetical protein